MSPLLFTVLFLSYLAQICFGYDYVVIGGGTGGLTVASRLAERFRNLQILVLEAGSNVEDVLEVFIPGLFGTGRAATDLNWNYTTIPQANMKNRTLSIKAGKALGGSTTINGMIFPRGQKEQYDNWGILNNDQSWTWDALLPFFKKSERFSPPSAFQASNRAKFLPEFHGLDTVNGRVKVGFPNFFFRQAELWEETAIRLGFRPSPDLSNGEPQAIGVCPNSIDASNNTRCSAVCGYLSRLKDRPNLKIITNATVSRIIWSSNRKGSSDLVASGVEYFLQNETKPSIADVRGEVIVSAGTVGSPKVLELSGVGNSTILKAAGVKVSLEHPSIGENFADHLHSFTNAFSNATITNDLLLQDQTFAQQQLDLWFKNRTGLYSAATARTLAIVPPSKIFTDAELKDLIASSKANLQKFARQFSNGNPDLAKGIENQHKLVLDLYASDKAGPLEMNLFAGYSGPTPFPQRPLRNFTSLTVVLYSPLSRGRTHINSSNPFVPALTDPAFWSHPLDVAAHVSGLKLARKMLTSPPLSSIYNGEFEPGLNVTTSEGVENYLRSTANGDNHPVGTMAMLPRELGGVVDTKLRIYGIRNVRVVDASIIPAPVSAHTSSTVYMVGERAADIIANDLLHSPNERSSSQP